MFSLADKRGKSCVISLPVGIISDLVPACNLSSSYLCYEKESLTELFRTMEQIRQDATVSDLYQRF
jgi:hypothetical protein